jgi:hypothetical protein
MAALAVHVQGVAPRGVAVGAVAVLAAAGHRIILLFVMTIVAGKPIPIVVCMGLVIEQDAACGGF